MNGYLVKDFFRRYLADRYLVHSPGPRANQSSEANQALDSWSEANDQSGISISGT